MNSLEFLLRENVLTDNILIVPKKGLIFKGGYVALIKEFTFLNAWQDKETHKKFKKKETLIAYLDKHYPDNDVDFHGTCLE
jgi:hypothetical protein